MSSGSYDTPSSSGHWSTGDRSVGTERSSASAGGWKSAASKGYSTDANKRNDFSTAAVNSMSASKWNVNLNRGHGSGMSGDRDSWQSDNWEYGSSRGHGSSRGTSLKNLDTSRGRESARGYSSFRNQDSSRNRDITRSRDSSTDHDTCRGHESTSSGHWSSGQSGGLSNKSSRGHSINPSVRGQDTVQTGREGGSLGYFSNRESDSGTGHGLESSVKYMTSGIEMMNQVYSRDSSNSVSITEQAMDILKAVLGPSKYDSRGNQTQDYASVKRKCSNYEEDDGYHRGQQSQSERPRNESRWGPSSHTEKYSKHSDDNRWGQQASRHERVSEENRWGTQTPRNTRRDESHSGSRWGSQSGVEQQHYGNTNVDTKDSWVGPSSHKRNQETFSYQQDTQSKWSGGVGRSEGRWGSQSHGNQHRQSREPKINHRGSHSQSQYIGKDVQQKWEPHSSNKGREDQNDQRWGSGSYGEPPEKRRKPLLGLRPDVDEPKPKVLLGSFEKPQNKTLLGSHPDAKKSKSKPKPLLGPYPGHDKPKTLLGPYPGFENVKSRSLLGPYPGHKQRADEESRWEKQMSGRGAVRDRGGRSGGRVSRGRRGRERQFPDSFGMESVGYEEIQSELQSFNDEYCEYQGSWNNESKWDSFEQFEGGCNYDFWESPSMQDAQGWQHSEFAWQCDDPQAQQFGQQSGILMPPKPSVRERLGGKKPALLGAGPSVDLVKQLLTPEERKRLSKRYGNLPLEALFCHMCNQTKFTTVDSYLMHQIGKKHVAMTKSFHAKTNTAFLMLKTEVELEFKRDRSTVHKPQVGFCVICDIPTFGGSPHNGILANKMLHRFVRSICCRQRFVTRLGFENHRLSLKHLENEYHRIQAAEERCKKRLSDLKEELKAANLDDEVKIIEEEKKAVEKTRLVTDRIEKMWRIMMPRMNLPTNNEKLPEKITVLKTLREINLRMKKPIKNSSQFMPYDPSEPVGIGNMIILTHFRCNICSKSIDPSKESVIAHCSSKDHYKNAVKKREELLNAEKVTEERAKVVKEQEKDESEETGNPAVEQNQEEVEEEDEEMGEEETDDNDEEMEDEPMEDPYEGESGDISTLLNEVEEMIDNEGNCDLGGDAEESLPEGYEDADELIYDENEIAEEFRDVLDYDPEEHDEEMNCEKLSQKPRSSKRSSAPSRVKTRRGRSSAQKSKPASRTTRSVKKK
ncbi:hypothetical protein SK128_024925 [Halocaridina rubra]|uniref:Uncharacterized protein n=1 Tax=Halocaridina rubra TaxID=373956 RepID=A0AAN8XR65_HALRR